MGKNNSQFDLWRVLRLAALVSLGLGYIVQWMQMISNPTDRTGTDFIHFYAAGQVAQRFGFSAVYELDLQQKIEEEVVGFSLMKGQVLPYNHVPYLIPFLRILVNDNYVVSFERWVLILLLVYTAGNIFFIHSIFSSRWGFENFTLLGGTITFYPFFVSLLLGQDTAFLFLGATLWCVGILKKNDWLAGLGLALTTIRPHICLVLAIPFLFRDRKIWWRFFILALVLSGFSFLILGSKGTTEFMNLLLVTAGGNWYGTHQSSMVNLLGLMLRLLPFVAENITRLMAWVGYAFGIVLTITLWLRAREFDGHVLGLSLITALSLAPHLHYHDLALLILPILLAIKTNLPNYSVSKSTALLLGISFVLFISPALPPMYFILPYLLYLSLIWVFLHQVSGRQQALESS